MRKILLTAAGGVFLLFVGIIIGFGSGSKHASENVKGVAQQAVSTVPFAFIPTTQAKKTEKYPVTKVIDADTIEVMISGKKQTVRLIGIDSPETVDPRKPIQCFGQEASQKMHSLTDGKNVVLESDPTQSDKDKYKRILRYVFLEDGSFVNKIMVEQGFAREYTYQIPYKYQSEFKQAEEEARDRRLGLWADNACSSSASPITKGLMSHPVDSGQGEVNTQNIKQNSDTKSFFCDCSKACFKIKTCEEAYFQLNNCECSKRDSDGDGVPCESLCR